MAQVAAAIAAFAALLAITATARDGGVAEEGASKPARSAAAMREFRRLHPCPATGEVRGSCPGWVVDHVRPLCAGGPDTPPNMQWQTIEDAKVKDADERRLCRSLKR